MSLYDNSNWRIREQLTRMRLEEREAELTRLAERRRQLREASAGKPRASALPFRRLVRWLQG